MRKILALLALMAATPAIAQSPSLMTSTSAVSSSLIVRASPMLVTGVNITTGATAGYLMLFDARTVPADGAVAPRRCVPVAANTGLEVTFRDYGLRFEQGVVMVFSSTGCFTKTSSATAFMAGDGR